MQQRIFLVILLLAIDVLAVEVELGVTIIKIDHGVSDVSENDGPYIEGRIKQIQEIPLTPTECQKGKEIVQFKDIYAQPMIKIKDTNTIILIETKVIGGGSRKILRLPEKEGFLHLKIQEGDSYLDISKPGYFSLKVPCEPEESSRFQAVLADSTLTFGPSLLI